VVSGSSRGSERSGGSGERRIAIATCAELPDLDDEGRLLLERCGAAGLAAEPVVWDDPGVGWERYERVLLRSTWDYPEKVEAFADWVAERGARLINPPAVVAWNLSKRYLDELASWGLPTVPTSFLSAGGGESFEPPEGREFVVKPAVSVGSRDAARYRPTERERAAAHVAELRGDGREVMVQPYLDSVENAAETTVVMIGGSYSHAMRKAALLELDQELETGLFRPEQMQRRRPEEDELELARATLARLGEEVGPTTYARVDLLRSSHGEPLILELELIEPSLFLDHFPAAADRLVALLGEPTRLGV
jgi:glutathione synthase/RimK-type ligase-like ATP-grasp enzyme